VRPLTSLVALQRLDLSSCNQLRDVAELSALAGLSLDISGCRQLTDSASGGAVL
jgi:hypothetical protein